MNKSQGTRDEGSQNAAITGSEGRGTASVVRLCRRHDYKLSAVEEIRTPDLLFRRQTLYPTELRPHCEYSIIVPMPSFN